MGLYEPEQIAAYLLDALLTDALVTLLPGGIQETDAADRDAAAGATTARRRTPYLVFSCLAGNNDIQGAGGTLLVTDLDYAIQVMYRPGEHAAAREALRIVQGVLEGQDVSVAASGDVSAHGIIVRSAGVLPRTADREAGGRLVYAEGRRWKIRFQRI